MPVDASTSDLELRKAVYAALTGSAALLAKVKNGEEVGIYPDRIPKGAPLSRELAALSFTVDTRLSRHGKLESTVAVNVFAHRADLVDEVSGLVESVLASQTRAVPHKALAVAGARARSRLDQRTTVADRASDLVQKSLRFRVLLAPQLAE